MKDYKMLFILGLLVLIFPFLGIPEFFRNMFVAVIGVLLVTYSFYKRNIVKKQIVKNNSSVFEESDTVISEEILIEGEAFEEELIKKGNE